MTKLTTLLKEAAKYPFLQVPYLKKVYNAYQSCPWYPGHFYSTIPLLADIEKRKREIFEDEDIKDINFNIDAQFSLVESLQSYYDAMPFEFEINKTGTTRYQCKDAYYRYSDVVFLYCIMRHFKPKKIIEVGSGHSSAVMLDTNQLFFEDKIQMAFIEPYPEERLAKILLPEDNECSTVYKTFVQEIEVEFFRGLSENDILFIDSSHVSKIGSDVNYLFFKVLPELKPGVMIHIHDIFFPFELPAEWILKNKCFWNEIYLLRAFLMNNNNYEIVMFNSLLQKKNTDWFRRNMPVCLIDDEFTGSIWLRKIM